MTSGSHRVPLAYATGDDRLRLCDIDTDRLEELPPEYVTCTGTSRRDPGETGRIPFSFEFDVLHGFPGILGRGEEHARSHGHDGDEGPIHYLERQVLDTHFQEAAAR